MSAAPGVLLDPVALERLLLELANEELPAEPEPLPCTYRGCPRDARVYLGFGRYHGELLRAPYCIAHALTLKWGGAKIEKAWRVA